MPDFITDRSYMGFKATTPRFLGEEITQTNDDFDLVNLAFDHFVPSVFVEHYDSFRSFAIGSVPMPAVRGVIGSTSWYYRERFKFIAAEVCESGGRSIGVQHGGNYGLQKNHPILKREVLDRGAILHGGWTTVSALNDQRLSYGSSFPQIMRNKTAYKKLIILDIKSCLQVLRYQDFLDGLGKTILKYSRKRLMSPESNFFEQLRIEFRRSCVFRGNRAVWVGSD